jgi:hypothetical protein
MSGYNIDNILRLKTRKKKRENLRLVVEQVVVEGIELECFVCTSHYHLVLDVVLFVD